MSAALSCRLDKFYHVTNASATYLLQVGMFQCCTNAFIDEFDFLKTKKVLFTAALCIIELLAGLPCITKVSNVFLFPSTIYWAVTVFEWSKCVIFAISDAK